DTDGKHVLFHRYIYKVGAARISGTSWGSVADQREVVRNYQWPAASRYGILTDLGKDGWRVWWIPAADVPFEGRSWVFGRGSVRPALADLGPGDPFPDDQARPLGLKRPIE